MKRIKYRLNRRIKKCYKILQVLRHADPKLRKAILQNGGCELYKSIAECALNVLSGNIALSPCLLRKLGKFKGPLRQVSDKRVSLAKKKRIIQKGGWIIPLLSAVLPTLASLVIGRHAST
jgi:hypothetical protein